MRVEDVMTKSVRTCAAGESAVEAREQMRLHNFHHLVVVDGSKVLGILSERDLRSSLKHDASIGDVMTSPVVTARPETTIREAANLLRGRSIGCLPVVKGAKLVGIVTVTDLLEIIGKGNIFPPPRLKPIRRSAVTPRRM